MNRKCFLPIILGLILSAIILLVSAIENAESEDARLHLNFKEDVSLIPETNPREGGPYPALTVNAQYTELGVTRINKQWVDIETWTSDDRDANMSITFETLNFFYSIAQEGYDADPELRVTIMIDGVEIFQDTHGFTDHDDGEVREEFMDFPEILYRVAQNETLEFMLEYSGFEDLVFSYDHRIHDSGVTAVTDFLYTWNMSAKDRDVVLEVGDIFHSDWEGVGNFINLSVDGEPRDNQSFTVEQGVSHNESGFIINSSYITWELDEPLQGSEEVEIWIKYIDADPGANLGMRKTVTADQGDLRKPFAEITSIDPETANEGDEIFFDASGSSDEDGSVVGYRWESDLDGVLYDGEDDEFVRSDLSLGVHEITLKVMDDDDLWSEEVDAEIEVVERPVNKIPTVVLDAPANSSTIDLTHVVLYWEGEDGDDDDLSYDVYFDDNSDPQTMIAEDIPDEELEVSGLEDGFIYYWKVVVNDGTDEAESEVWSFTVELPPEPENTAPTVQLLSPQNTQVEGTLQVELGWSGDDDDGDDLTYDVYLGTNPSGLTLVTGNLTNTSYLLTGLQDGQVLFWNVVVSDGTVSVESPTWSFSIDLKEEGGGEDEEEWYEEPIYIGGLTTGIIVVVIVVSFLFLRRRNEQYYDDWGDEEEYY